MTGSKGIATKTTDLETFVEYSLYISSSTLACADSSNQLNFLKEFELTLSQIREFFNNSPKRLLFYIKTAYQRYFGTFSKLYYRLKESQMAYGKRFF